MGTSAVDLPDPLQAAPDTAQNADDLLAQLAGDEIDRLLAEADGDAKTPKRRPRQEPVDEPEASATAASDEAAPVEAPVPSPGEVADVQPEPVDPAPAATTPPADSAASSPAPDAPAAAAEEPPSVATALGEELAQEEAATAAAVSEVSDAASLPAVLDEVLSTSAADVEAVPSFLLRPLYWLNKPFEELSDETRSVLGKVAILTLLNAVAVIGYVMFLRG